MPESATDTQLENLLAYRDVDMTDEDLFVVDVMRGVRKQRMTRRLILLSFGLVGAMFGLFGAVLLSDAINNLFTDAIPATRAMQAVLLVSGIAAFYVWVMGDDLALER